MDGCHFGEFVVQNFCCWFYSRVVGWMGVPSKPKDFVCFQSSLTFPAETCCILTIFCELGANESNSRSNFLRQEEGRVDHNRQNLLKLLPSSPLLRTHPPHQLWQTKGESCKTNNAHKKEPSTCFKQWIAIVQWNVLSPKSKVRVGEKVCQPRTQRESMQIKGRTGRMICKSIVK